MSLRNIVRVLGGDLYDGGLRANIPAPGHSARDRSVSLLWAEGRIIVHSFGRAHWRDVLGHLKDLGLVGTAAVPGAALRRPSPTLEQRLAAARRLWAGTRPLPGTLAERHLRIRRVRRGAGEAVRFHPAAPVAVYADGRACRPAMVVAIRNLSGALTAVELTYLDTAGRRASDLGLSRKTVGAVPAGSAVRLDNAAASLLVAEGVVTALSASERFGRPAWALLSAQNLARWAPPDLVRRVLVAGDRGAAGEDAANALAFRLGRGGFDAAIALPPPPFGDWNEAATAEGEGEGG